MNKNNSEEITGIDKRENEAEPYNDGSASLIITKLRIQLAKMINTIVAQKEWKQKYATEVFEISQPRMSNLQNLQVEKFSVDKLVELLGIVKVKFAIRYKLSSDSNLRKYSPYGSVSLKEQCVKAINDLIRINQWESQKAIAKEFGLSQPRVSTLINGHTEMFSIESMLDILSKQGHEIEIVQNGNESSYFISILPRAYN